VSECMTVPRTGAGSRRSWKRRRTFDRGLPTFLGRMILSDAGRSVWLQRYDNRKAGVGRTRPSASGF